MPAIYHEGSWLGNATDPEVLVKDTVGWTGKNGAYSQTNNAVIAHIENGITYDVSWTGSATVTLKKNSASGATITSGSTSPLSFTADADYELYFRSSATVTNIMVKDSRITDPTYEPYHESVEEEIEQIYADNGVLGAKNLLENKATTATIKSVVMTVNSDKTVTANGTNDGTGNSTFVLNSALSLKAGSYILSGGVNADVYLNLYKSVSPYTTYAKAFANDVKFTLSADDTVVVQCVVGNGKTASNAVFKPMLRLASDPDDTYQPYAMTNRELTEVAGRIVRYPAEWNSDLNLDTNKGGNIYRYGKVYLVSYWFKATTAISGNTPIIKLPKNNLYNGNYTIAVNNDGAVWGGTVRKDGNDYVSISCPIVAGNLYRAQCIFIDPS